MKKIQALALAVLLSLTGCSGNRQNSESTATNVAVDHISMTVITDQVQYDGKTPVLLTVTVTNTSGQVLQYVVGSGSNTVPDALEIDISGLVPMYMPEVMTMDYQLSVLTPGEVLEMACPYAPFVPVSEGTPLPSPGTGLSAYETEDFNPAESGTIKTGISFSYTIAEGDEANWQFSEEDVRTLDCTVDVNIK